ncbi:MAG: DUF4159 domain-containing protein [Fibrobacter sp.]|nr:DUF4159 domain-containing protein [Fibrobacter sp.]
MKRCLRFALPTILLICGLFGQVAAQQCGFTLARLKYGGGGDWYANPSSLPNLIKAVKQRTLIPVCDTVAVVSITDKDLFHHPFLYMTGHGDIRLTNAEKMRLRKFLIGGGFLWADDNYGLDQSLRRELASIFPENPLTELPSSHPVYTSFYKLPGLPKIHEHDSKPAQGMGIFFEGRMVVFYSYSSDIGDGMEDLHVHNDGQELHELALRMGVNVISWFFNP